MLWVVLQAMFLVHCRDLAQDGSGLEAVLACFNVMLDEHNAQGRLDFFKLPNCKSGLLLEVLVALLIRQLNGIKAAIRKQYICF